MKSLGVQPTKQPCLFACFCGWDQVQSGALEDTALKSLVASIAPFVNHQASIARLSAPVFCACACMGRGCAFMMCVLQQKQPPTMYSHLNASTLQHAGFFSGLVLCVFLCVFVLCIYATVLFSCIPSMIGVWVRLCLCPQGQWVI